MNQIREHIISRLKSELPALLTYHNLAHTLEVESQCMFIAKEEGVTDEQILFEF